MRGGGQSSLSDAGPAEQQCVRYVSSNLKTDDIFFLNYSIKTLVVLC